MNAITIKDIFEEERKGEPGWASFEVIQTRVSVIRDNDDWTYYLRVYKKTCAQEANGRPETNIIDCCYPISDPREITSKNWKDHLRKCRAEGKGKTLERTSYEGV